LQVYPRSPLLSSQQAAWQAIALGYYTQPAHTTPEYAPTQHLISIHLSSPSTCEQQWRHQSGNKEQQAYGDITINPASCFVREKWDREVEFLEIYLSSSFFSTTACEILDSDSVEILPRTVVRDPLIQSIGLTLKTELESRLKKNTTFPSSIYVESAAHLLSVHLLKHYSTHKPVLRDYGNKLPDYKLKRVLAYIEENLDEEISLSAIANEVGMSQHYFSRLFKKSTGITPYQYVLKARIEQAKKLLLQSQLSIAEIALEVGFASQSHFTQSFKRFTGVTPRQLIKQ
jgi:AraC family transcriptional regulator